MNFLFLFGLVFLSGCIHRSDIKDTDSKASKVEINKDEGGALVTPSKNLKALRLKDISTQHHEEQKKTASSSSVHISKESIQARLTDIPVMIGARLLHAHIDIKNNKHLFYSTTRKSSDLLIYYQEALERSGWLCKIQYNDDLYVVITAKKPHKNAVISFEYHQGTWLASPSTSIHIIVAAV